MRRFSALALLSAIVAFVAASPATAGTWKIDTAHSVLDFKVRHLFSNTGGQFDKWAGTMNFDPADMTKGSVEITIETASINTRNEDRDNHLRSADFFDAENHPTITFVSQKVVKNGEQWELHGDLTMRGMTKPVVIPFEFHGAGKDPWGNERVGFSGELDINRKDFGIEWNKALDQGGLLLGENVHIDIEIEAMAVADQTQAGR